MAATLGCSRTTVTAAIDELIAEGYVIARPRSGLYASPRLQRIHAARPVAAEPASWTDRLIPAPDVHTVGDVEWTRMPYPLITGQIAPSMLARRGWKRALRAATDDVEWSYAEHGGNDPMLVEQICRVVAPSRGIVAEPENVLVTMGSQHALMLVAFALIHELESTVAIEDPGYPDARAVLAARGARLVGVPVDEHGLRVDHLGSDVSMVYVTPSHQHPTNVTLSVGRRVELLETARRNGIVIIEDDYDSELRFSGTPSLALYSLDRGSHTIYLGTFSKLHSPGLRIGFVIADPTVIDALRPRLQLSVRQVPGLLQRALGLFIRSGDYTRALTAYRRELGRRWMLMNDLIGEHLGVDTEFPPGGTSLWTPAPDGIDWARVIEPARRRGVLLGDPAQHWLDPRAPYSRLRLGFTAMQADRLPDAVRLLAEACAESRARRD